MKTYQMMHFPLEGAGTGIYVDSLANSLINKGHQVKVLCSGHRLPGKSYPVEAVLFNNGENEKFDVETGYILSGFAIVLKLIRKYIVIKRSKPKLRSFLFQFIIYNS